MKCWISPYELESAKALNSRTERRKYRGALIRVGSGFGCLHPWVELGDPSLEECLADLAGGQKLGLVKRALDCAAFDGEAREKSVSLSDGLKIPKSHFLMSEISEEPMTEAVERGFHVVKVKAGRDVEAEMEQIRELGARFPDFKWRVDFNEMAQCEELERILSEWDAEELARIDFLEDPSPFDPDEWGRLPVAVANDRAMAVDGGRSEVLVAKPAVEKIPGDRSQRVVVTSYLDHPLGQCFAAFEAGKAGITEICGLQSHGMFSANPFAEELGLPGPIFQGGKGVGLGFGELLEGLSWKRLES